LDTVKPAVETIGPSVSLMFSRTILHIEPNRITGNDPYREPAVDLRVVFGEIGFRWRRVGERLSKRAGRSARESRLYIAPNEDIAVGFS